MYLMRNLVSDAYSESGVTGQGMTMTAEQLSEGISTLNLILDNVYTQDMGFTTTKINVDFTVSTTVLGSYLIGPTPFAPTSATELPDFIVDMAPVTIDQITIIQNGIRSTCLPIDSEVYYSKSLDTINNSLPEYFYYERTQPLSVINFYNGVPQGIGELILKTSLLDVNANTDFALYTRALKPYLVYELAAKIATKNQFNAIDLRAQANIYWNDYVKATYEGQHYNADLSAPNSCGNNKYNIYTGY